MHRTVGLYIVRSYIYILVVKKTPKFGEDLNV